MVTITGCAVSGSGQCRRGGLQGCVVGHGKAPIVRDIPRLIILQIASHDVQQVLDLFAAAPMSFEPAVLNPIFEAHARLRLQRPSFALAHFSESGSSSSASRHIPTADTPSD